jgi:hypothetical protein
LESNSETGTAKSIDDKIFALLVDIDNTAIDGYDYELLFPRAIELVRTFINTLEVGKDIH